jgi:L-aminopeptidase/D-esterase-like protein
LLDPRRTVDRVDAVIVSGGSAFGLAACDGVVRWCEERGLGWPTSAGPVPIVIGVVVFDLLVGDPSVRPGSDAGYAACVAATDGPLERGAVGAGAGATIAKWQGRESMRPGGVGHALAQHDDLIVAALAVVNAVGEPRADGPPAEPRVPVGPSQVEPPAVGEATTIAVVVTNARLDKVGCRRVAESGQDGLARALDPAHTAGDGDAVVAAATGAVDAPLEVVRSLTAWVVERAVLDGAA